MHRTDKYSEHGSIIKWFWVRVQLHDILWISQTYLDSSVSIDNTTLSVPGYNLVRSEYPSNVKRSVFACIVKEVYL